MGKRIRTPSPMKAHLLDANGRTFCGLLISALAGREVGTEPCLTCRKNLEKRRRRES